MDLALAIWHIDPAAEYLLDDSANPTTIVEWRGPGPQPTPAELDESWQWCLTHILDPDWIDPSWSEAEQKKQAARLDLQGTPGWVDWTVDQAETWIEDNVHGEPSVKIALKAMARLLVDLRDWTKIIA